MEEVDEASIAVVVVDDDPGVAELTARALKREYSQISTRTVTSPAEALAIVETGGVDCVVSDYEMPEMDGLELLEAVREVAPNLPFILYTGRGSEEVAAEAVSRGVSDYVRKERGMGHFALLGKDIRDAVGEEALRSELSRVREALDSTTDGVCLLGEDGTIEYTNEAYLDLYGYTEEQLVGKDWSDLHPDEEVTRAYSKVAPLFEGLESWSGDLVGERRSGERFDESASVEPLRGGGFVVVVTASSRTVSDRPA